MRNMLVLGAALTLASACISKERFDYNSGQQGNLSFVTGFMHANVPFLVVVERLSSGTFTCHQEIHWRETTEDCSFDGPQVNVVAVTTATCTGAECKIASSREVQVLAAAGGTVSLTVSAVLDDGSLLTDSVDLKVDDQSIAVQCEGGCPAPYPVLVGTEFVVDASLMQGGKRVEGVVPPVTKPDGIVSIDLTGVVRALAPGEAEIIWEENDLKAKLVVRVVAPEQVVGVELHHAAQPDMWSDADADPLGPVVGSSADFFNGAALMPVWTLADGQRALGGVAALEATARSEDFVLNRDNRGLTVELWDQNGMCTGSGVQLVDRIGAAELDVTLAESCW